MSYSLENTTICNNVEMLEMLNNPNVSNITDIESLGKNSFIVTRESDDLEIKLSSLSHKHNINVAIAAAVTALARIEMSKFKNRADITLFYSDTRSATVSL